MSERPKGAPVWHKVFGVIETLALAACATGERIGFITPTPEGTKTNPTEIAPTPSVGTIPTSAAETAIATSVEFLGQDEVLATKLSETQTLTDLFVKFEADTQIKGLFTDPDTIEYSAMGIKAYMAESGKTVAYPFFSAMSETEKKGYTAMVLQPSAEEVVYQVLNRIVDADGKVGLGITQDLNHQLLEKPVMIFATGLTADQIAKMTDEELSRINLLFIPAGLPISPSEAPFGVGRYLVSLKPVEPTPTPMPEGLNSLPAGIIAVRNADGTWGVGIDEGDQTKVIAHVSVDARGFHFTTEESVIDIATAEMAKRLKAGQASPLQIYNEAETAILYAFDAENKVWVDAVKVLQPDRNNPENYIKIQTWDDIKELARKEKMVLPRSSGDIYFPPLEKIYRDYEDFSNLSTENEFNFFTPFGILPDGKKSPFSYVNYIVLEKGEERKVNSYIVTEQVDNPDGSISVLHFGADEFETGMGLNTILGFSDDENTFLLPSYMNQVPFTDSIFQICTWDCNGLLFLKEKGYIDASGNLVGIRPLVEEWFGTGIIPAELENIFHYPVKGYFKFH